MVTVYFKNNPPAQFEIIGRLINDGVHLQFDFVSMSTRVSSSSSVSHHRAIFRIEDIVGYAVSTEFIK